MHVTRSALFAVGLTLAVSACSDPAKDKAKAQVDTAKEPVAAATTGGEKLPLADGSKLEFTGSKVTGHHDGGFKGVTGTITLVDGKAERSSISVDVDTTTVYTDEEKLTGHLKSPDFFDVAKFPKANFTSTAITPGGEKGATHTVVGNLDLHGVKKSITFPATIAITGDQVTAKAEFSINRKDFGIVYAGKADDLIRDDVVLRFDIKANRKK